VDGFQLRSGEQKDSEWLWDLYRQSMEDYVTVAWGWDEEFQRDGFAEHLGFNHWIIVRYKHRDLGGYVLKTRADHFWLELLVLKSEYQNRGIGSRVVEHLQDIAHPLRLSVFKTNPAVNFYLRHGFVRFAEDDHSFKMEWKRTPGEYLND